jgi:hypothetical protein
MSGEQAYKKTFKHNRNNNLKREYKLLLDPLKTIQANYRREIAN